MTKDKATKRAVRTRMEKTGESYTTARHYLLESEPAASIEPVESAPGETAVPLPARVAEPGMSDEAIARATGRDWDTWLGLLDTWGALERTHAEIAKHVSTEYEIGGWWAQNVTVGYERARGMRERNEHADGYSVTVSKTFSAPIDRLYAAVAEESARCRWLDSESIRVRSSTENKVWRCEMVADQSRVELRFTAKRADKTSFALEHARLPATEDVEAMRAFWKERFAALAELLTV